MAVANSNLLVTAPSNFIDRQMDLHPTLASIVLVLDYYRFASRFIVKATATAKADAKATAKHICYLYYFINQTTFLH